MKKGIEELFLRHGITARIILSYILFVIVPFLIMAMVVVNIFQDYIYSNLGNATMDAMSSAGFQISKEIRKRKEDSMFVYYNDIIEFLCKEERTKEDKDAIEKKSVPVCMLQKGHQVPVSLICRVRYMEKEFMQQFLREWIYTRRKSWRQEGNAAGM